MNHDLINLIYGIKPGQRVIYCSHCGHPMYLKKDRSGSTRLVCLRCIELWEESQREMEYNLRINEEKRKRWKQRRREREEDTDEM